MPLFTRRSAAVVATMFVAFGLLLRWEGRIGWCKYGFGIWTGAHSHCTSQNVLDPYSLSHVLHGVIFFWLLVPLAPYLALAWRLIIALAVEIGWELFENSTFVIERYRQNTASLDYTGDSILNSQSDLACALIGFIIAARVSWKAALGIFFAFELIQLYLAKDNLTLNILMLLWPIEAIKQWQMAA
jgi:hypothetical protein